MLHERFLRGAEQTARIAGDDAQLGVSVLCPSRDPQAPRTMLVREQLEFIAAYNAYHLAASICCVSYSERDRRLRVETSGEKSHVRPRRLQAEVNQERLPTVKLPAIFFILIRKFLRAIQRAC